MVDAGGGAGHDGGGDKAREEFFSEAQELIDTISRDLLAIDELAKQGRTDAELLNDVFRGVHTLKGLAGLFGATLVTGLSHELEDVLDELRLGRIDLSPPLLDLLFRAVEIFTRLLTVDRAEVTTPDAEVDALLAALGSHRAATPGATLASPVAQFELDPALLGVLTEYEEHRLKTSIQNGLPLYRLMVSFQLQSIDASLDDLKAKARPHGEIITYLPTGAGGDADSIELEILMASGSAPAVLRSALESNTVRIEEVRRRTANTAPPPSEVALESPTAMRSAPNFSVATPSAPPGAISLRSVAQTVRVDIRKLDHLMNIVGELAIVRTGIGRLADRARRGDAGRDVALELIRLHRTFERNLAQMQHGILEVRMVPLGQAFDKLARVVRQLSREHHKEINLVITGAETEIDKLIVEELSDPLMHMVRNAIDHGIEAREERVKVGKPPLGTIALNAFQKGNQVVLEVEDDGRGMDATAIATAAVARGLLTEEQARDMGPREAFALVFLPGFTTRSSATDTSGRGVGMDVVKQNLSKLGGVVDISSEPGIGTKVTLTLPITLAIIGVLMVEVAGRALAVPLANVEEAIVLDERAVRTIDGREVLNQRGRSLVLCRLGELFGWSARASDAPRRKAYVLVGLVGGRRLGLVVDALVSQDDIVIKALGPSLARVRGFSGATELGDQRVALVLDVAALVEETFAGEAERSGPELLTSREGAD